MSVCSSTHPPAQQVGSVAVHVVPQPPQLFGSVCSFTQTPLHTVSTLGHAQTPLSQVSPVGLIVEQFVPHPPQLLSSVCSFTQTPLHPVSPLAQQTPFDSVSPPGQVQLPLWQLCPVAMHFVPHTPQLLSSLPRPVVQQPSEGAEGASPGGHWHVADTHEAPDGHELPHPPQLSGLVCSFTHIGSAPHGVSPLGQVQRPPWQPAPAGQLAPQVPQLLALVVVSTHVVPPHIVLQVHEPFAHT